MKAVLDSNIIVSALLSPQGACAKLLALVHEGRVSLALSPEIVAEYRRATVYPEVAKRLGSHVGQATALVNSLQVVAEMHEPAHTEPVVSDPKDDMFIACAMAAHAQVIVSYDKHLTNLVSYRGIQILRPGELLGVLLSNP